MEKILQFINVFYWCFHLFLFQTLIQDMIKDFKPKSTRDYVYKKLLGTVWFTVKSTLSIYI